MATAQAAMGLALSTGNLPLHRDFRFRPAPIRAGMATARRDLAAPAKRVGGAAAKRPGSPSPKAAYSRALGTSSRRTVRHGEEPRRGRLLPAPRPPEYSARKRIPPGSEQWM